MTTRKPAPINGHRIARVGMLTGLGTSLAANVAHTYVRPADAAVGVPWSPEVGAVIGAMFWPIALLITTEILMRNAWPDGGSWVALRVLGIVPVALVSGVISYGHVHALLLHYHEGALGAAIGPLSIDGLMLVSAGALMAPRPRVAVRPARTVRKPVRAVRPRVVPVEQAA